jgi:hypothetical protein
MTNELLILSDVNAILAGLSVLAVGLLYLMPDVCWMTEKTMAKALKVQTRDISAAKWELQRAGLIKIESLSNKPNRINPIHKIVKVLPNHLLPIQEEYGWILRERELIISPQVQETVDNSILVAENVPTLDEFDLVTESNQISLNWELLKNYSAADINRMSKLEQVELFMEIGFLVLPTHYPIFSPTGNEACSCRKREECHSIGKHPAVNNWNLTPKTYERKRKDYLQRFRKDKDLNVGFKTFGYSVLDVDYQHGGAESLAYLRDEVNGLDETLAAQTANGLHLYTSTVGLNQSTGLIGKGLDIRSDKTNGFIVAPCSIHRSKKQYQWQSVNELQPIPTEWLHVNDVVENDVKEIKRRGKTGLSLKHITIPSDVYSGYEIPVGRRYYTLFKWACRLRGRGANESYIYDVLLTLLPYCKESENPKDNITSFELRSIAKSVVRHYPTNFEKLNANKAA